MLNLKNICFAAFFLISGIAIASGIWNIVNGIDVMGSVISTIWVIVACLTIYLEHKKIISKFASNAIWTVLIIECLIDILTSDLNGFVFWVSVITCIIVLIGTLMDNKDDEEE
jgi:hypothetical protein